MRFPECRSGERGYRNGSPSSLVMSSLPWYWYYLGDIATVLYQQDARLADEECGPPPFRQEVLDDLMDSGAPSTAVHPVRLYLQAVVAREESRGQRKKEYGWSRWPAEIEVKVRKHMPKRLQTPRGQVSRRDHDFILGPSHLVLPWPFDASIAGSEDFFRVEPFDEGTDYDPKTDTLGDLLLAAGDDLVSGPGLSRLSGPTDPDIRSKLIEWVQKQMGQPNFDLPPSIDVKAVDAASTTTHLDVQPGKITLVLGADQAGKQKELEEILYAKWPCGAFGP